MKPSNGQSSLNTQILEEASAWFIEFSEGEVEDAARRDFNQWLRVSPEHVRAYLQVSAFWNDAPLLNRSRRLSAEELIARARTHGKVLPIAAAASPLHGRRRENSGRFWSKMRPSVAIAASIAIVTVAGIAAWMVFVRNVYSTGIGEQRSVTLADGSTIELNAHSRVRVRFSDAERTAILLDGQALFHVAKDSARPFVVRSEAIRVRAVGTQFDVNQIHAGTVVTVLEGRVAVLPTSMISGSSDSGAGAGSPAAERPVPPARTQVSVGEVPASPDALEPVYVSAGEQLTVVGSTSRPLTRADAAAVTAWRQRRLQFAAAPLTEVADEYNRYHEKRLIVRDPRLDDFHVSGVFSATDSASLLEFLRQQPTLTVRESATEIEISRR